MPLRPNIQENISVKSNFDKNSLCPWLEDKQNRIRSQPYDIDALILPFSPHTVSRPSLQDVIVPAAHSLRAFLLLLVRIEIAIACRSIFFKRYEITCTLVHCLYICRTTTA